MWFYKRASMFSPVHCVWLLVSLCVCGTSNFERFYLRRYYRFAICFTIRFVHFTCVFGCDSCEMRKRNVVQMVACSMKGVSEVCNFSVVVIVKRGVLFMFLSPLGMFLCIFVCLSFYLFNDLYI